MRWAPTVLGVALCAAWGGQVWIASNRPDPAAQAELLDRLAEHLEADDELAYLPGWELGWAIQMERRFADHPRRLGVEDLGRPAARIWVVSSPDAPPVPAVLGTLRETLRVAGLKAERYALDGPVVPLIEGWTHAGCRLALKRTVCSSGRGSVRRSELIFDGRFARGQKLTLKDKAVFELGWTPSVSGRLVGGVGHTDHGARHGLSPVDVRVVQAGKELATWRLNGVTGLRPIEVAVVAGKPVTLTFSTVHGARNEVALSLGFAP